MEERLQKILSRYGVASRRKAETLIAERRVRVNGNTAVLGDTAVDGEDVIEVDGVRLKREPERLPVLTRPIEIEGRMTQPAKVRVLREQDGTALLEFVIHEGRNRQLRRPCEAAELRVTRLRRIREGTLALGELPVGKWRALTEDELSALQDEL